jgi:hypothetical protein
MCSRTNFRPLDTDVFDASRIPRLDEGFWIAAIESKELAKKRYDANGQAPKIRINAPDSIPNIGGIYSNGWIRGTEAGEKKNA